MNKIVWHYTLRVQKLPVTAYFVCRNIIATLDYVIIKCSKLPVTPSFEVE